MRVLFSVSNHDLVSWYMSAHAQLLIDYAVEQGHEVSILYNDDPQNPARLLQFEAELQKKPDLLIGLGHGSKSSFTGQDLEVLLKMNVNDDLLSGVKSYLYSCLTAQELGPSAVDKTCPLYIGYTSDWTFIYNPQYEDRPLDDPWAKAFFDCGLAPGYGLLAGQAPKDIYEATLARYDYWYDYWTKENSPMADDILTWLNWDKQAFTVLTADGIYAGAPSPLGIDVQQLLIPAVAGVALFFMLK
uniref:Uncharacterized protein n=1 Tax=viral metagenome TaxID=1070528 RepID=A0A6M3J6K2_9ZZZZ